MSETFKHHDFDEAQDSASAAIRGTAEELEVIIDLRCKPSREKSLALTKLEECIMWANKSLSIHGVWDGEHDEL